MARTANNVLRAITEPTNGGSDTISLSNPYSVEVTVRGSADLLLHRWNCEAVSEKASAPKNSRSKKNDDLESYVYRNSKGEISIPGEYFRQSIINAAKFRQDPRSPRKSAMDLFKAGLVCLTDLASLGKKTWDYEDRRRCVVHGNGINRVRPAFRAGWMVTFDLMVLLSEYISEDVLREVVGNAGRLIGIADFRPTFGRFFVISWKRK